MFKTETHLHTAETSPCGRVSAVEMVKQYYKAGYRTLFISDHFYEKYFESLGNLTWDEKVEQFLKGYRVAKETGEALGMHILLAAELRLNCSINDYLLYGIDENLLKCMQHVFEMTIEEFYSYAKEHGITVIQAHPYRDYKCTPTPESVDGFEAHNSNPRHENFYEKVMELASEYKKPVIAGSDAHRPQDIALSGVMTRQEICTVQDFLQAFYENELVLIKEDETL